VQACAAAYRSFRESDCSYQPYGGPRKYCDAAAAGPGQAFASPPPAHEHRALSRNRDERDLQEAVRTVRGLPPPPDVEYGDDDRGIVEVEPDYGPRSGLQRRWIIKRR
jgi:hypothetical protein